MPERALAALGWRPFADETPSGEPTSAEALPTPRARPRSAKGNQHRQLDVLFSQGGNLEAIAANQDCPGAAARRRSGSGSAERRAMMGAEKADRQSPSSLAQKPPFLPLSTRDDHRRSLQRWRGRGTCARAVERVTNCEKSRRRKIVRRGRGRSTSGQDIGRQAAADID